MPRPLFEAEPRNLADIVSRGKDRFEILSEDVQIVSSQQVGERVKADRRAQSARLRGMSLANSLREANGGACPEWCLVKPTLASPIFFLQWVNTDEHEFYSEHFS